MLFHEHVFLFVFLPVVLALWWSPLGRSELRFPVLALASYAFYGWWDARYVGLLLLSTAVDHAAGKAIAGSTVPRVRRAWLVASVATNLGILAGFKYAGFFADTVNALAGDRALTVPAVVLPVGISFYTFQSMSYTIDVYRERVPPAESFWRFAAYVAMFPQLVAGPIVRYHEIADQLRTVVGEAHAERIHRGIVFFVLGLAQKILLADPVGVRVDALLEDPSSLTLITGWAAMLGFTLQIYFDFSGYSLMAVGLGSLLGYALPQNFDSPYRATSVADFWRRWHMTLSFWLRDYLYVPLGGNRGSRGRTAANLMATMLLGGLWHGAAWTFVLWGGYHGLLLMAYHAGWSRLAWKLPRPVAIAVTFLVVALGWVLFRSEDLAMCGTWLAAIAGANGLGAVAAAGGMLPVLALGALLVFVWIAPNTWELSIPATRTWAWALASLTVVCVLLFDQPSPFLYFQF